MWIKVEGGGFTKYKALSFTKHPNYFTMEDMVLAISADIVHTYTGDWVFHWGFGAQGPGVEKAQKLTDRGAIVPG